MLKRTLFVALAVLIPGSAASAATIHVPADQPDIQTAINVAATGDEIVVAPDTYSEKINFFGKAITVRSSAGPLSTTIDASGLSDSVVKCVSGEGPSTVLEGFTLRGGYAGLGGGMYNLGSSPTVTNCIFRDNIAVQRGGGMHNRNSSNPVVTDCTFTDNQANVGGGMCNRGNSNPTVSNCAFYSNYAEVGAGMRNVFSSSPTVTECVFEFNDGDHGSGMCNYGESNPTVSDCTFEYNVAQLGGGAMYNNQSSPVISDCFFRMNEAEHGGAISNYYNSSPTMSRCVFTENAAFSGGGIINHHTSHATVGNCLFADNEAWLYGGAMYNEDSSPTVRRVRFVGNRAWAGGATFDFDFACPALTNCSFTGNSADEHGGAMYVYAFSDPIVTNCSFTGNVAQQEGGAMYNFGGRPLLVNSVLWEDSCSTGGEVCNGAGMALIENCNIEGCANSGQNWNEGIGQDQGGNIDYDPRFADADGFDDVIGTEDDNLRLECDSPAIDAGNNLAVPAGITTDLAGNPRFIDDPRTPDTGMPDGVNPIVDMGALEYQIPLCSWDLTYDGTVDVRDFLRLLANWGNPRCVYDLDGNGEADVEDFLLILANWGDCPSDGGGG
ncbi:MAG: right-handed parallel beta-helix repeat-containing protein [Planctomycetota bacterium]|jgi:hypothetical protein